jgi:prepilin-type N-terminal cleavage/methylation domain-containing protein
MRSAEQSSGFTLIEVLLTILLISILVAVVIPQFMNLGNDAKTAVTTDRMNSLKAAIVGDARFNTAGQLTKLGFEINCTGLPSSLTDLITQPTSGNCASAYNPFTKQGWRGPYVSTTDPNWNKDAWGTAIQYFNTGPPARTLRSCGPDLVCGTADDITITF